METTSAIGVFRQRFGTPQGRGRGTAGRTSGSTAMPRANGFLNHSFHAKELLPYRELMARGKLESGFFRSLANLCQLHGIELPNVSKIPYPDNLRQAIATVRGEFDKRDIPFGLEVMQDRFRNTMLATQEFLANGFELFYIPVCTIYRKWKEMPEDTTALLGLSLFAYFHKVLEIPYHTEYESYVCESYRAIAEYLENMEEEGGEEWEETKAELLGELNGIGFMGEELLKEITLETHLALFETRVMEYRPETDSQANFHKVCKDALSLFREYPRQSLMQAISRGRPDDHGYHMNAEMYIGFFWGDESEFVTEEMDERLNSYAGECATMDRPANLQLFGKKQKRIHHDLDFQKRVMDLLDKIAYSLYRI